MQAIARRSRAAGRRIGFVPTMGFLHEGHLSLIRIARRRCELLVVSIFVNPIQFGPGEDFTDYPRDRDRDKLLCRRENVDVLFCPSNDEMYPEDHTVYVDETVLSRGLCGASRPGHFRGVTTVVAKLFNTVQPHLAVFGQKDAQQARIIEKMAADLDFPVRIVRGPIVRESDGLAMSSRNKYLSREDRARATVVFKSLRLAKSLLSQGTRQTSVVRRAVREALGATPRVEVEYVATVDDRTLKPVTRVAGPTLLAVAVRIGGTRLIDNVVLRPRSAPSGRGASYA